MQSINFEIGNIKEYAINGDEGRTIKFDVSDFGFIERFKTAYEEISQAAEEYKGAEKVSEEFFAEVDKRIRGIVNKAFNSDVCTAAFGNTNCFSVASNGNAVIVNFLEALTPIIERDFGESVGARKTELDKKTDKYTAPIVGIPTADILPANIDISSLTQEQKNAMLRELLR